jgi:hypothetical protein
MEASEKNPAWAKSQLATFIVQTTTAKAAWLARPASFGTTEMRFTDLGDGRVRFDGETLACLFGLDDHDDGVVSRDDKNEMWMWIGGSEYLVWRES